MGRGRKNRWEGKQWIVCIGEGGKVKRVRIGLRE
jgi:hypothetical protein